MFITGLTFSEFSVFHWNIIIICERKVNNNGSMCFPSGFMHRCYFVGHQDETGCIQNFLLSLSENRSKQACVKRSSGKHLIILSIFHKVKTTAVPQMTTDDTLTYSNVVKLFRLHRYICTQTKWATIGSVIVIKQLLTILSTFVHSQWAFRFQDSLEVLKTPTYHYTQQIMLYC